MPGAGDGGRDRGGDGELEFNGDTASAQEGENFRRWKDGESCTTT